MAPERRRGGRRRLGRIHEVPTSCRRRGAWEQRVLARLRRSLVKVTAELPGDRFGDEQWRALLAGTEE